MGGGRPPHGREAGRHLCVGPEAQAAGWGALLKERDVPRIGVLAPQSISPRRPLSCLLTATPA